MKNLINIILSVLSCPDHSIFFDEPVIVKKEQESIYECWAVAINAGLWLMDEKGDWNELEETDQNAQLVIDSLSERLSNQAIAA